MTSSEDQLAGYANWKGPSWDGLVGAVHFLLTEVHDTDLWSTRQVTTDGREEAPEQWQP